ncbi:RHS repeat-associated core domain-containing protein [Citrobacter sedlakii]|uniref:RHS repeat-associated core domain-containing protein n=1 Tax=Citrobacter sedlakii TaxID=67826 RepID=UPI002B22DEE6|nr:RHS repeat-associated core domain-containing protein [Citrobacter sedlakii]MEB0949567.1 RHS repeat-associated core domain-containing protein [Citrobacter sedlakii]
MGGKQAARQGDMTMVGGPIVQGSAGVLIGAPTGVACSVCPTGEASPKYGNPVNPLLGAKVLPGETDIALPGPLPFVLSRAYSSYRTRTPAPVGLCGPGWKLPSDLRLQIRSDGLILNDNGGRSVHFEPMAQGEIQYSRSESFWMARGGAESQHNSHPLSAVWGTLPEAVRLCPHIYLTTNSPQGPWWVLGWPERVPGADEVLPAPLPPYRVLTGVVDGYGRRLVYHRDGTYGGAVTGVTDGTGRCYRLVLTTQAQRAAQAASASSSPLSPAFSQPLSSSLSSLHSPSSWPETLPATAYGEDSGVRLSAVWLVEDPAYPDDLPSQPLVLYGYTARGELEAMYDRSGAEVRRFEYDAGHPGRMIAHRYAGRPASRYRYDEAGRVTEQVNPEGLGYAFAYEKNKIMVTDSLGRREVLHTEGEGGLKRVVMKEQADGSVIRSGYDGSGRLEWRTDAAGRKTIYSPDVATGKLTAVTGPDGRKTKYGYNDQQQLITTVYPDGRSSTREYDRQGRLVKTVSREGKATEYAYGGAHDTQPSVIKNSTGSRRIRRGRNGEVVSRTDCSGYETRYEYNRYGQQTAVHYEEGLSVYRRYDRRGRLSLVKDRLGRETKYDYNDAGDLTAVTRPNGQRRVAEYDVRGRLISLTEGGRTRRAGYDAAGRVVRLENENGAEMRFVYDALNRVTEQRGFDGRTQRYDYDRSGRLERSEDEDLITHWRYDASDRLMQRTVNGQEAERWQYDERGWLTALSHISEGLRVTVHYGYDNKGRLTGERQMIHNPETEELLWAHSVRHGYNDQGQAVREEYDGLPVAEWLTYGSGHLAGLKLGNQPLVEYTRDRLHRETERLFGAWRMETGYTAGGEVAYRHLPEMALNREYRHDESGFLTGIDGAGESWRYGYDGAGRLSVAGLTTREIRVDIPYETDGAGNRVEAGAERREANGLLGVFADNRVTEDGRYVYRYDRYGNLVEKGERVPAGMVLSGDERTHHYSYDRQHRLVSYRCTEGYSGRSITESRYVYDVTGRRVSKKVWQRERYATGRYHDYTALPENPEVTWYGWSGDRLVTSETERSRIQTVYEGGGFMPLIRVETATAALTTVRSRRSLAEKLQAEGREDGASVVFPAALVRRLDSLEAELRAGRVSGESRAWLSQCGLTAEQMAGQMEPRHEPERKIHLYHCDHRGLPVALVDGEGKTAWRAEYDVWGNRQKEENPQLLEQLLRLPGQQYDEESGLHYNRHRYYNPGQGRYITQDPIGLRGGWNLYKYPLNPVQRIDPLGLEDEGDIFSEFNGDEAAADGLARYLEDHGASSEEVVTAVDAHTRGVGGWNPGAQYVELLGIGTPVIAGTILTGPASSLAALADGSLSLGEMAIGGLSSCAAVATTDYMDDGKTPDISELALCSFGGIFGAGKGFLEKTAMKMGASFLSKGTDIQAGVNAAASTGAEEIVGGAAGKLPYTPDNSYGDYVGDIFSSGFVKWLEDDDEK